MTKQEKQQIDSDAEREALALSRAGKYHRPKRLRLQVKSYSENKFDKLFALSKK